MTTRDTFSTKGQGSTTATWGMLPEMTADERRREQQQLALWQLHLSLAATQGAFGDDWREVVERAVSEVGGD